MLLLITTVHVIFSLMLILLVLLQSGKGAEMGAVFGGSSQTIFGSRGAATFLSKITAWCAVGFVCTALTLVVVNSSASRSSIMQVNEPEKATTSQETAAPAKPSTPPTTQATTPETEKKPHEPAKGSPKSPTK